MTTYVTFLYELDRTNWPNKWKRSFDDYLERWNATLNSLSKSNLNVIAFGSDKRVELIANQYPKIQFKSKKINEWDSWSHLEKTKIALTNKYSERVPETFSPEYICLQLCKFDAIQYCINNFNFNTDHWVWIDGGLRQSMTPPSWDVEWNDNNKVHVSFFSPFKNDNIKLFSTYQTNLKSFVVGTCWGGNSINILWLCKQIQFYNINLLEKQLCANDQELLSLVYSLHPEKFVARKAYIRSKWNCIIPWQKCWLAINSNFEEPLDEKNILYLIYIGVLFIILFVIVFNKNVSASNMVTRI